MTQDLLVALKNAGLFDRWTQLYLKALLRFSSFLLGVCYSYTEIPPPC